MLLLYLRAELCRAVPYHDDDDDADDIFLQQQQLRNE